jgi:hypothetical protein
MLKPFHELAEFDVSSFCAMREGKDEKGNKIYIPYLPWVKCLRLLHDPEVGGAERVRYRALPAPDGSYVFCGERHLNKEREGACYFVTVEVEIDGEIYTMPFPVMNGTAVVYKDTLNQLRVSNAIQRAFVKCVAVNTGLGIKLWEKDDESTDNGKQPEEVFPHTPLLVKEQIEKMITAKLKGGMANTEILQRLGIGGKEYKSILQGLENASWLLSVLPKI